MSDSADVITFRMSLLQLQITVVNYFSNYWHFVWFLSSCLDFDKLNKALVKFKKKFSKLLAAVQLSACKIVQAWLKTLRTG